MHGPRHTPDDAGSAARVLYRGRVGVRGAMFVEAVIVISFMVVALTGLMFFKEYYGKQLRAMRLARAAAIVYSMGACKEDANDPNKPVAWTDKDKAKLNATTAPKDVDQDPGMSNAMQQSGASYGQQSAQQGGAMDSGNMLNKMVMTVFSGEAKIQEQRSPLAGGTKDIFKGTVQSKSYVSCGDEVLTGSTFDQMVEKIIGVFKSFW
jgi:hypothetical protein